MGNKQDMLRKRLLRQGPVQLHHMFITWYMLSDIYSFYLCSSDHFISCAVPIMAKVRSLNWPIRFDILVSRREAVALWTVSFLCASVNKLFVLNKWNIQGKVKLSTAPCLINIIIIHQHGFIFFLYSVMTPTIPSIHTPVTKVYTYPVSVTVFRTN